MTAYAEKLRAIERWTYQFLIENHDHSPDGKYLGRIIVFEGGIHTDYTDYHNTTEEVVNDAYDLVKDNLWTIVSQHL